MTPKKKAIELCQKYDFVYIQNYTSKHEVKQCAIIAVDEIIKSKPYWDTQEEFEYWYEVKEEIEKL